MVRRARALVLATLTGRRQRTVIQPHPTMSPQREAARAANALRGEMLEAIYDGVLTPTDVVLHAADPTNRPLLSMLLLDILSVAPGVSEPASRRRLHRLAATLELREDLTGKSIGWLLDRRAGGRRLLAWLDAEQPRLPPWPGFPWTPQPAHPRRPDR
jgi:hypothetical protein